MGGSPLLGPWPEWVSKGSTPSLIPSERNDADSEAEGLLKIDYQSLPSPPSPTIFPMDATIFNFSAVLQTALDYSLWQDRFRYQNYGSESMESRRGYTPEHLRERWSEKLRRDEEDLLRSIYESDSETDESYRDPSETVEDREKKRRSRLKWASPRTKAILDKMGIETIGGPKPHSSSFPPTPLPDSNAGEVQPIATPLMEAQPDDIYPHPPPSQQLNLVELAMTHPRLVKRLNGEQDETENRNATPGLHVLASNACEPSEAGKVHPFKQDAYIWTNMKKDDAKGTKDSNGSPKLNIAGNMSHITTNSSPLTEALQQPSPPLSISPNSWVEGNVKGKAHKKRTHNNLSKSPAEDSDIHCKRRRMETGTFDPGIKAGTRETRKGKRRR